MTRVNGSGDSGAFERLTARLITSPLPPLLALLAVVGGAVALLITPREEEPQIVVPFADVIVEAPGLGAAQIERQVATPLEKLLFQIDGVEYVYSMSRPGQAVVTVRFYVGEDREDALVRLYNKINSNLDRVPAAVTSWVVKPVEIDDVPIVLAVLWSDDADRIGDHELRRLAEEIEHRLQSVENTNRVEVTGGRPRKIRIELNPEALAARRTAPLDVAWAIQVSNDRRTAGTVQQLDESLGVEAGTFIEDADALRRLTVNVIDGVPVYLGDVSTVMDGPAEPVSYTWIGFGPAAQQDARSPTRTHPATVLSVAKKKGANAVQVAREIEEQLAQLEEELFPPSVHYRIIRDYGITADDKVNNLVVSLAVAVLTVVVFIAIFIGPRAALIVALAVPICYGLTLLLGLASGYTINRVTLFALILAIGLLVDDPITGVDNIERYYRSKGLEPIRAIVGAMAEIRGALIMSTIAIVLAFAPMFFITGMMGPYMAPLAFNVPIAVTISTIVAFVFTPWLAYRVFPRESPQHKDEGALTFAQRAYAYLLNPLIESPVRAWTFLLIVFVLFLAASTLPMLRVVPLKLLPYDNKDELQIVIDLPEGTTLERTDAVARELAQYLRTVPEVRDFTAFVGSASPMDFNGMIRHYYLRAEPHQADLRVTLAPKNQRAQQSHALGLALRSELDAIADRYDARIKLVEAPPGPPVVATLTAEIYGALTTPYRVLQDAAGTIAQRLEKEPLTVDIDTSVEADQGKFVFITDKEKAALSGIATEDIGRTLALATGGLTVGFLQVPTEARPLPIELRLPLERRSVPTDLNGLYVKGRLGIAVVRERGGTRQAPQPLVQLGELGHFERVIEDQTRYHKNLRPVAYAFADVAGRVPAEIIADIAADRRQVDPGGATNSTSSKTDRRPLSERSYLSPGGDLPWSVPRDVQIVWSGEGEWFITLRVFRDLGIAFAAAVAGIFLVLYLQTGLAGLAGITVLAIPLSVIGIMPGFWLLNSLGGHTVNGYPDPTLFTATAMIGMIALAGIVVRNSLILIEFIQLSLREGERLKSALVQAGAVRMRPVLLTAGTTVLGNLVITLDPVFSGLAWAIIFGILASTLFTLGVIPVVYFLAYRNRPGHGLPGAAVRE